MLSDLRPAEPAREPTFLPVESRTLRVKNGGTNLLGCAACKATLPVANLLEPMRNLVGLYLTAALVLTAQQISERDAFRLLQRATFGPVRAEVEKVSTAGYRM